MRKLIIILLYCLGNLIAQDIWTAFSIETCVLEKITYPWGEELSLQIKGSANAQLVDESIRINVFFENTEFKEYYILLKQSNYNNIVFSLFKEPLNNPMQSIAAGTYTVNFNLLINEYSQIQKEKLKQLSQGKQIRSYSYSFTIGTEEEIKAQNKENKVFYLRQIKALNNLLDDIFIQQKFVFQPTRPNNPYYQTTEKFNMQAWRDWFQKINKELEEQNLILQQQYKKLYTLRYPQTHQYLEIYNLLIKKIALQYANAVYNFKKAPDSKFVPPYKMDELYEELNGIYNMHQEMQKELKVNIKKVLGYFPPPPVLRP
jgi:hypothetical protein